MTLVLACLLAFLVGLIVGLAVWHGARSRSAAESASLKEKVVALEKEREAVGEKLDWMRKAEENMRDAFKALASDSLKSNSEVLTAQVKKDFQGVVDPLKESLTSLDGHVRTLEKSREGAYMEMVQRLSELRETHTKLQQSTVSLTEALRSPTVRGRWGEIQLRRVVEMAGMLKHVAFDEQAATELGRPDMVAYLPNRGVLPVDSKVPLTSYLAAMEAPDEETRKRHLDDHARAMKSRVKELGQKQYWDQFENAPDFVVMFVPNEACLGAAYERDPGLLEYAFEKQVLISSPVTLLALLRTVAYGWQQQQISENARRISEEGRDLYSRLENFIKHFGDLGESVDKVVRKYNAAVGSFERRLMPSARRFQELGLSGKEEIEAPVEVDLVPSLPASAGPEEGVDASPAEDAPDGEVEPAAHTERSGHPKR